MLHVQCKRCDAFALTNNHGNPDSALSCGCCTIEHSHGPKVCPNAEKHNEPCKTPTECDVHHGYLYKADGTGAEPANEGDCPGGHCGLGVKGCVVCRPVHLTLMAPVEEVIPAGVALMGGGA